MIENPAANSRDIRDTGLISGPGRSPGGGHGNPLQYSGLKNPMDYSQSGYSVHSPGKNTGVGFHALLQGIFSTQGSNPVLLHCRQILYNLSMGLPQDTEY